MQDSQGYFANALVGAVVGGLIGGLSSALEGDGFGQGFIKGFVSGAIAGAAVDIAVATVATGGLGAVALAGVVAIGGGMVSSMFEDQYDSLAETGKLKKVDSTMLTKAVCYGFVNLGSFGFSAGLKYAFAGKAAFNQSKKLILKEAFKGGSDVAEKAIGGLANDAVSTFAAVQFSAQGTIISGCF